MFIYTKGNKKVLVGAVGVKWKEILLRWEESEIRERKTEKISIRFTKSQIELLREISFHAGFEDASNYIRWLIWRDLRERAEDDTGEAKEMAWY